MVVEKLSLIQNKIMDIAMALTAEKDYNKLLYKIVDEARNITNADGGTLYLLTDNKLHHKIMQTKSMAFYKGGLGETIGIEPLELNEAVVSSYCAINRELINIKDVYETDLFDFSGPRKFDEMTGYQTKSMLVCPLISRKKKVVGILQLINATDKDGNVIEFDSDYEYIIESLASQAGISIENMQYLEEIRKLFESFVQVIAKTIDERTPYNKMHSENLAIRIKDFAQYLNQVKEGPLKDLFFSDAHIYKLVTAAWLHDIGKIVVPLEILDKPTRLDYRYEILMDRYTLIQLKMEINYLRNVVEKGYVKEQEEKYADDINKLMDIREFVTEINTLSTYVDDEKIVKIYDIAKYQFENILEPILTKEELKHLTIRKGTLTTDERKLIEEHISAGARILSKLEFPDYLENIYDWIINHHEYLDGSGYARGLKANEISTESRMMTILDIFDSLVQSNRPYKKAFAPDKAISILMSMSNEGKLDENLVQAFIDSELWKK